jgi:hypothetical protein
MMIGTDCPEGTQEEMGNVTYYTSCNPPRPNNFVAADANPYENIWMGWYASLKGYQGFLRWAYDNWSVTDPANLQVGGYTSGDFAIAYRSSNELDMKLHASVRMELIREGIEDYEKIIILKNLLKDAESAYPQKQYAILMAQLEKFDLKAWDPRELELLLNEGRMLLNEIATFLK